MQRMSRFSRYWDLVANSGRFGNTLPLLLKDAAFDNFMAFADWLYATTGKTHQLALERLFDLLHAYLILNHDVETVEIPLLADYAATGAKGKLGFMKRGLSVDSAPRAAKNATPPRQLRHAV
jgi:hypothetical protein